MDWFLSTFTGICTGTVLVMCYLWYIFRKQTYQVRNKPSTSFDNPYLPDRAGIAFKVASAASPRLMGISKRIPSDEMEEFQCAPASKPKIAPPVSTTITLQSANNQEHVASTNVNLDPDTVEHFNSKLRREFAEFIARDKISQNTISFPTFDQNLDTEQSKNEKIKNSAIERPAHNNDVSEYWDPSSFKGSAPTLSMVVDSHFINDYEVVIKERIAV